MARVIARITPSQNMSRSRNPGPDDLQLEIVRDVEHQATHAVVAVRFKDEWLILDNRTLLMLNADASSYRYLVALDHSGARTFATEVERRRTVQTGFPLAIFTMIRRLRSQRTLP